MNRGIFVVLCALLLAPCLPAFTEEAAKSSEPAPRVDAEVPIVGQRQLDQMRNEVIAAEDRFLAKYNALNKQRKYRISCFMVTSTGTRVSHRECRPEFVGDATQDQSSGWLDTYSTPPSKMVILEKSDGFAKNMAELVKNHPELAKLATERIAAETRYNDALKRRFSGEKPNK